MEEAVLAETGGAGEEAREELYKFVSWILESHFRLEGCDMNNYAGLLLAPHRLTT